METLRNIKSGQETLANIISECWRDNEFKNKFINHPIAVIEEFSGKTIKVPDNKVLKVEDQTHSNFIYLNIPAKPDLDNVELSDEELEKVSGGWTWTIAAAYAVYEICSGAYDAGAQCK